MWVIYLEIGVAAAAGGADRLVDLAQEQKIGPVNAALLVLTA
jgi:hypothetical protein